MSNLLEQAIIDAAALRETALKSAKNALVEKYKEDFKQTVERLLEEEDLQQNAEAGAEQDQGTANNLASDQAAGNLGSSEEKNIEDDAFKDVMSSFFDEDGDPDELITIDFDKLKKQAGAVNSPMLATPSAAQVPQQQPEQPEQTQQQNSALAESYEIDESLLEEDEGTTSESETMEESEELEEELELELENQELEEELDEDLDEEIQLELEESEELEEVYRDDERDALSEEGELEESEELEEQTDDGSQIVQADNIVGQSEKKLGDAKAAAAMARANMARAQAAKNKEEKLEEEYEITEEELAELEEHLRVDLDAQKQLRGHMGTTEGEQRLKRNVDLASARDSDRTEERKEEEAAAKDLECKLDEAKEENKRLNLLIEDLKDNLISLKEHVEKLSVSNAKLLYINKVFGDSSLNERQKENIVETISRSKTVLEAKTIYGTLQSAAQGVSERKPKESLSEALIRSNSPFITRPKASIDEGFSDRMKILAGIK